MKAMNSKIKVGILWNTLSLFLTRGASTIFMLFLARVLAPETFGLIAMVTVVFELANVFINSGLGAALIRSKEVSKADLDTVFYSNLVISFLVYIVIYSSASFIAEFYRQPELTSLVQVMGLVVFINAAKIVQTAIFSRHMDFKSLMKANSIATVISGILALIAAYQGWGVWSLVVQMLSQSTVSAIALWSFGKWSPGRGFSQESFLRLFAFGRNLLAEGIFSVVYQNSTLLVIGRFFSAELTGLYFFAQKINNLVSRQLTSVVQQATFPALATIQDDNESLKYKYRQILQLLIFLVAPIMMLLAAMAPLIFRLIFDNKWQASVPYLQILCVVGMIFPIHALNVNLMNVKGRSDLVFKVGLVKKSVNISLLFLAIPHGVLAIALSQVIGAILALVPNTHISAKLIDYSLSEQVKDAIKPIIAAVFCGFLAWWVAKQLQTHQVITLVLSTGVGSGAYLLASIVLRVEGALMLWTQLTKRLNNA
jgi:lipopolysaccharide exporter